MIILPDRKIPKTKLLMPVPKRQWYTSLSLPRDQLGNEVVKTVFRLRGRTSDGAYKYFWFEDRDDADAFLFALVSGSLIYERELWRLPVPNWHPDIGEGLTYDFVTTTYLTATLQNTYSRPFDWNNANNTIECVGSGGSGGAARRSSATGMVAAGGGGGGYAKYVNLPLSGNATYACGRGGAAVTVTTNTSSSGFQGGSTYFNGTSILDASVYATGGGFGTAQRGSASVTCLGGSGGTGTGTATATGGRGGQGDQTGSSRGARGGGGAAGPNGNGNQGGDYSGSTVTSTNGGSGDAGSGGSSGSGNAVGSGTNGGAGTEWGSYGSGGGGGGGSDGANCSGGSGGNYGGGGGGCTAGSTATGFTAVSGAGVDGLIVVAYEPLNHISVNLAMMGM